MKKTRRIAAMVAAMAIAATMTAPSMAFAADGSDVIVNVQIAQTGDSTFGNSAPEDKVDHTYMAYQIFTGKRIQTAGADTPGNTNDDKFEFRVTGWGADAASLQTNAKFLNFRPAPEKDSIAEAISKVTEDKTSAAAAIAAASALDGIGNESPEAKELADILGGILTTGGTKIVKTDGADLAEGYYLVTDNYDANTTNDAKSRFILRVNSSEFGESMTIVPKKSYPEVIKKVQENEKSVLTDWINENPTRLEDKVDTSELWNDVADYNIGDDVPFQLYGSMPETLDDYSAYYYKFTDTLGSQFDQPETVKVTVGSKVLNFTLTELVVPTEEGGINTVTEYELPEDDRLAGQPAYNEKTHKEYKATANFLNQITEALGTSQSWTAETTDNAKLEYVYNNWGTLTAYVGEESPENGPLYALGYTADMNKDKYIIVKTVVDEPEHAVIAADATTDGNCRVKWDGDTHQLVVSFEDIKAYEGVNKNTIVTVEYTAKLNETAVIGLDGQENKVDLTYSNNPNLDYKPYTKDNEEDVPTDESGKEETDKTPEDKVVVFTYEIDIEKIDGDTKVKLEGAEFQLKKGGTPIKFVDNGNGTYTVADQTLTTGYTETITSDSDGLFKLIGVDSGTYVLTEIAAPEGYSIPASPDFTVVLTAETKNTQKYTSVDYPAAEDVLTDIAGTINGAEMTVLAPVADKVGVKGTIENNKGTSLPGTGGMGTSLFVLGGGVTAALAGIYLVSKKRAK